MSRMFRAVILPLVLLSIAASSSASAQSTVAGAWTGAIHVMGQDLAIEVTFTPGAGESKALITIAQQGVKDLALTNVKLDASTVHFELPAGPSVAVFDGTVAAGGISGTFVQGGVKGTFDLKRSAPKAPEPPPPYRQEEVKIANGAVTLAGTLTVPPTPGRHPVAVLITGSGPQDRDEDIFGFKIFRVIADHLTRQGIAVLRCDDRGVGGSTGKTAESTTEDFATDVLAEVAYLKTRNDIDAARIGLVGHSEGGIIAPMVASRSSDVSFIVLLSGPALRGDKILVAQGERLLKANGAGPEILARQTRSQQRLFDVVRGKATAEEVTREFSAEAEKQVAALPEETRKKALAQAAVQIEGQLKGAQTPWFRFFLDYDPAPALAKVRCPVLAMFGELDLQVPVDINKGAMDDIFAKSGNAKATTRVFAKANHLYQEAKTGSVTEYATLKKEFVPEFLPALTTWVKQQVAKGSN